MTNKIQDLLKKARSAIAREKVPDTHQDNHQDSHQELHEDDITTELNLDEVKITLKDRFNEKVRELKDGINRLNVTKFRTMKLDRAPDSEETSNSTHKAKAQIFIAKLKQLNGQSLRHFQHELFSPRRWNQIHKIFQVTFIFGLTFIVGKSLALISSNLADSPRANFGNRISFAPQNDFIFTELKNAGIFRTDSTGPVGNAEQPDFTQERACSEASRQSTLPIRLLNTIVLQDSIKSVASVQVRSGRELTQVRVGDNLNGMAKVDRIERQRIIIKNLQDGNCEAIENMDQDTSPRSNIAMMSPRESRQFTQNKKNVQGISNDGNNFTIEKNFIQEKMKNISDVLTQARGIQMTNPDGSLAFKIVEIEPGGIFSYLGIQNNDVITQINGKKITNLNEVMSLFGKISNVDKMNLTINRNGEEVPLEYNIK